MKILLFALSIVGFVAVAIWTRRRATDGVPAARVGTATGLVRERLLSGYPLQQKETGFFGEWRETTIDGRRVAFQWSGPHLSIIVGKFDSDEEQLSDVYLDRVPNGQEAPSERRIDVAMGPEAGPLAERFMLNADLSEDHALERPEVRQILLELSSAVSSIHVFDSNGVQLDLDAASLRPDHVRSDVKHAVSIASMLE